MALDPITIGIISSIIGEGIISLARYGAFKAENLNEKQASIKKNLESNPILISTIRDVTSNISKNYSFTQKESVSKKMQFFLESSTVVRIIRQMYSDFLYEIDVKSTKDLQNEFQISLAYALNEDENKVKDLSNDLFVLISIGCREAFNLAIDQGILSAHEIKSVERHRVLLDEISAIKNNLDFLKSHTELDLDAIHNFEKQYRRQVGKRYSKIIVPHPDKTVVVDIEKIFIQPCFIHLSANKEIDLGTLLIEEFMTVLDKVVLLGDPGGGKSTFAQNICYQICKYYDRKFVANRRLTPVLIVLRDYSLKKKQGKSIVQFVEDETTSKYQFPQKPPAKAFEYMLNTGNLLVIFDGLDEILEPNHRQNIAADIESFCNLYPSTPILVTSRIVGYEKAPLDPNYFKTFRIAEFNDSQVEQYVRKWFAYDQILSPNEIKEKSDSFLKESQLVADLRSNPLMLALMCNLYRGAGHIPHNRPDVYRKCSEMLLEKWDPNRGIRITLSIPEPKNLLAHLAHWIYSNESLQSGVSEKRLMEESTKFLYPRRFETEEEAERAAKKFFEFCRGRAWVFSDMGMDTDGSPLYKFTHKTFLEYFTAIDIVRNNNTVEKLWKILNPRIRQRTWDVVSQLAFQIINEHVEGASDEFLTILMEEAQRNTLALWTYFSFGARCLRFIYPSPKTIRKLTSNIVRETIELAANRVIPLKEINLGELGKIRDIVDESDIEIEEHNRETEEVLNGLLQSAPEIRPTIADGLKKEIIYYSKERDQIAVAAFDLLYFIRKISQFDLRQIKDSGFNLSEYWRGLADEISETLCDRIERLSQDFFLVFLRKRYMVRPKIEELFQYFTPYHLFISVQHVILTNNYTSSLIETFFNSYLMGTRDSHKSAMELVSEIGFQMSKIELPCFSYPIIALKYNIFRSLAFSVWRSSKVISKTKRYDAKSPEIKVYTDKMFANSFYGLFFVFGIIIEMVEKSSNVERRKLRYALKYDIDSMKVIFDNLEASNAPGNEIIAQIIKDYKKGIPSDDLIQSLQSLKLPKNILNTIIKWVSRDITILYKVR